MRPGKTKGQKDLTLECSAKVAKLHATLRPRLVGRDFCVQSLSFRLEFDADAFIRVFVEREFDRFPFLH